MYVYGCTCVYMYMNISMCGVWVFVWVSTVLFGVCVGVCLRISVYMCSWVSVGLFPSVFVCVSVRVYVCRCRCECVFCGCMRLDMCLWEYTCAYLLVYGYTNIHTVPCV